MFEESSRYYDLIYSFKDYKGEAGRVDEIIKSRNPGARTLLDVACGTGAHIEHLRSHYEIEGLDINDVFLEVCRARNPEVPFHTGDMRTFRLEDRFDAVVCLFSSIGYMTTDEDLRAAVKTMAEHLVPGGVLIVEPWIFPEDFDDGYVDLLTAEEADLKIARASLSKREGNVSRLHLEYLITERDKGTRHFVEEHELGLFEPADYIEAFQRAGLEDIEHDPSGLIGRGLVIGSLGL
jgi:SAM-dependent methyltransferase